MRRWFAVLGLLLLTGASPGPSSNFGNPTATIGTSAVNGSASTPMRSDAAPAIPQCSASTFGACKVDGTTVTAVGGVLSAAGGSSCPTGMTCVVATGVAATDTAAIQAAVNTDYAIVLLEPGYFRTNAIVTVTHRNVTIMGWTGVFSAGLGGSTPPYPANTTVDCTAISFVATKGCFTVTNQNAHFSGFHILANSNLGLNCISEGDAGLLVDGNMSLDNCFIGVYIDTGVGTTTGFALNPLIRNSMIDYSYQVAIWCNSSCTDGMFGPDLIIETAGNNYPSVPKGAIYLGPNSIHNQTFGNFIDSSFGAPCFYIDATAEHSMINGNTCTASIGIWAFGSGGGINSISVIGNFFQTATATPIFDFAGPIGNFVFDDNTVDYGISGSTCYHAFSGTTIYGVFSGNYCGGGLPLYADTTTQGILSPWVDVWAKYISGYQPLTLTGSAIAAPNWQIGYSYYVALVHGTCAPCTLTNPTLYIDGKQGTLAFVQSATGGDTITCGTQYKGTCPNLSAATANQVTIVPWYTASTDVVLGAAITFSP
jgi:hypothetical protein